MSDPVAGLSVHTCTGNLVLGFSLLKTMNYRESLEVFQRDRRSVGTRDLIRRMSLADHSGARLASTAHCASSASK